MRVLIIRRLTYHLLYHNLTQTEMNQMHTLLHTAIKTALGLPQHAFTQLLLRLGVHNTIRELVEGHLNRQLQRLQRTRQGCLILSRLGYQTPRKPQQEDRTLLALIAFETNFTWLQFPEICTLTVMNAGDQQEHKASLESLAMTHRTHTGPLHRRGPVPTKTCCVSSRTR